MPEPRNLMLTATLGIAGAVVGVITWGLLGIGLVELGILARFDPFGVMEDPPEGSTATAVLEWSYPAFALLGAVFFPRIVRWMIRPAEGAA